MKLSTKTRYGTRFMIHLAKEYGNGLVQLREIAQRENISTKYLEQIVIPLKQAGFIVTSRGAGGGYRLSKSPKEVKVGDVVAALEGGKKIIECVAKPESCAMTHSCLSRPLWVLVSESMYDKLDAVTLEDVIEEGGYRA